MQQGNGTAVVAEQRFEGPALEALIGQLQQQPGS